jgi:transcriptional regulator with XRE-family HTH domain
MKKTRVNMRLKGKIIDRFQTQRKFAEAAGVDSARVSRIIRGRENISDIERRRWARILRTFEAEIF